MSDKILSLTKNKIAIWLKVFLTLLLVLPVMGHCGSFTLGPGLGVERVNDTFNVDLGIVRGLYRFDNGVTVGTVVMFGYVDYLDVPDEGRYEAIIGYSPTLSSSRISPYAFITKGVRSYFGVDSSIHYHTATFGNRYILNERIYFDSSYRHRNTSDMSWETGTVSFGVGYNISTRFSLQFNVGNTWGDYQGDQAVLALISRF